MTFSTFDGFGRAGQVSEARTSITGDFVGSTATFNYGYVTYAHRDLIHTVTRGTQVVTNAWAADRDVSAICQQFVRGLNETG